MPDTSSNPVTDRRVNFPVWLAEVKKAYEPCGGWDRTKIVNIAPALYIAANVWPRCDLPRKRRRKQYRMAIKRMRKKLNYNGR